MLAVENHPIVFADVKMPKSGLFEIHRSKISLHKAKVGYEYPTIRLPHTFLKLAGLSTRIYQTIYNGSLAFLTVIAPLKMLQKRPKPPYSHDDRAQQPTLNAGKRKVTSSPEQVVRRISAKTFSTSWRAYSY